MDAVYFVSLLVSTCVIGLGTKFIDGAYDDRVFNRKYAIIAAVVSGGLMGYWIGRDPLASAFLFAIVVCVAVTQKIDNPAFVLGTVITLLVPGFVSKTVYFDWLPFSLLVVAGVIDEEGNDAIMKIPSKAVQLFFKYRLSMEVMMFALTLFGHFPWEYLLAFISFDVGYQSMTYYVERVKAIRA